MTPAEMVAELRFRMLVMQLHRLGPRVLAEFLAELGADRLLREAIEEKLRRYAELSPLAVQLAGGDDFPPILGCAMPPWLRQRQAEHQRTVAYVMALIGRRAA